MRRKWMSKGSEVWTTLADKRALQCQMWQWALVGAGAIFNMRGTTSSAYKAQIE